MIEFISSPWTLGGFVTLVLGGGVLSWFMFPTVVGALVGTKAGRIVIFVLIAIAVTMLIVGQIFAAGEAKQKAQQKQRELEMLTSRIKTDDVWKSKTRAERIEELKGWSRD